MPGVQQGKASVPAGLLVPLHMAEVSPETLCGTGYMPEYPPRAEQGVPMAEHLDAALTPHTVPLGDSSPYSRSLGKRTDLFPQVPKASTKNPEYRTLPWHERRAGEWLALWGPAGNQEAEWQVINALSIPAPGGTSFARHCQSPCHHGL